jgi:hypothetical protein
MHTSHPCTYLKACNILWLVKVAHVTLTHAAIVVGVNSGTACHVCHGRRFPTAYPVRPENY